MMRTPEWLAHRYDEGQDAVHFVRAPRALRRSVPFLTDDHLEATDAPTISKRGDALAGAGGASPTHFIFHSAYCCSTLLAQAFDIPGAAHSLSEPQILNDMVGWRHRGGNPAEIGMVTDSALQLLARPFVEGEVTVIKPSNIVNGLATALLSIRPDARAVLLHAPLRLFLGSIARKGMWGRLWVRELLSRQLAEGMVDLGFEPRDYLLHTDLQAAAVGWLAQHRLFADMARKWPERVRTLDSETLVARPGETMAALAGLFDVALTEAQIASVVADVFARDSKSGKAFASGQRAADQSAAEAIHADEIEKVGSWAEAVAASAGIDMALPAPLLD
ncbi:hypothetical protein [Sphingopyxis sp.]|jgi:hypothetical protein|uniref:hypothetical protein n=1 Tax=Sphingopyxis sp. TaxID=1908224 RepID=UPI002DF0035B|nr:hypothetical protein [Sphingopyxis sp.]